MNTGFPESTINLEAYVFRLFGRDRLRVQAANEPCRGVELVGREDAAVDLVDGAQAAAPGLVRKHPVGPLHSWNLR